MKHTTHRIVAWRRRAFVSAALLLIPIVMQPGEAAAQTDRLPATGLGLGEPRYPTSPHHGARDGEGRVIPCRCRFGGREFRLGEVVCMSTHVGTVLARCDLIDNTTSWMPSATPCEVSSIQGAPSRGRLAAVAGSRQ